MMLITNLLSEYEIENSNAYLQTKMNNGSIIDEKSLSSKLLYIYLAFMNSNCKHILLIYTYLYVLVQVCNALEIRLYCAENIIYLIGISLIA